MSGEKQPPYVTILSDTVQIENYSGIARELHDLGFKSSFGLMRKPISGDQEMAALAAKLNALGVAFSYGRDWYPSAVVADLKERGLLQGEFTEIAWSGPGAWHLKKF